jgi:hypothetical protein
MGLDPENVDECFREMVERSDLGQGWSAIRSLARLDRNRSVREINAEVNRLVKRRWRNGSSATTFGYMLSHVDGIKRGDVVFARAGARIPGVGLVQGTKYQYLHGRPFPHRIGRVRWYTPTWLARAKSPVTRYNGIAQIQGKRPIAKRIWDQIRKKTDTGGGPSPGGKGKDGKRPGPSTPKERWQAKPIDTSESYKKEYRFNNEPRSVQVRARERRLVEEFKRFMMREKKRKFTSYLLPIPGNGPVYCDVLEEKRCTVVEAKAANNRSMVRMAIGQLHDYGRLAGQYFKRKPQLRILLPRKPSPELLGLFHSCGIGIFWKSSRGRFREIR